MRNTLITILLLAFSPPAPPAEQGAPLFQNKRQCPAVKIDLREGAEWEPSDEAIVERAKVRCGQFYPKSPCLKVVIKLPGQRYRVICGAPD